MSQCVLKLYITGHTAKSDNAIANLQLIYETYLKGQCEIVIIDVLEQPQLAENDKILATPTLVKAYPPPSRRIVGDLSDIDKVIRGLGLQIDVDLHRGGNA